MSLTTTQHRRDHTVPATVRPSRRIGHCGEGMTFHEGSEVGQLRQVIIHPNGLDLPRLTPTWGTDQAGPSIRCSGEETA